ncbi:MAG: PhnD/SsuA/transferrin family substrate-binding protein [Oscillatoriaceae bacterium SKW80]|nr:PhnD/SsuA/transferrin family substrate-binding protein [Oscillatoriaceae bacterium SKYG93]MCX8119367.1 PhnD/SsuA/transferrin family substrate-binding protein [Oscillatoriaceae bacterium SKW80]MDW8454834.1 PhnD/SsuA/transferrin family substrate-binding protein [Oscillatoriaceae cyanobacterium SKYGB_i_bin93]HIK28388.1 PhnD/SsuA/transferrin family substrate-binding protein [Oscillatoriaceae cyanobacterium M7585_C2015_266]
MKRREWLGYFLLFIAGCTVVNSGLQGESYNLAGNEPEKLRLAVTEVKGIEQLERDYGEFRIALEQISDRKIEFLPVNNYIESAVALNSDKVDLVLTGPSEYVVIRARTNAIPIIAITRPNYRSVIAVNAQSAIASVADLKGKTIALWDVGSTSGHIGPISLLSNAGLNPKSDLKILMLREKGLPALKNGSVDAWGGSMIKYKKFLLDESLSENQFRLIATGPLLPSDVLVASSKITPKFVEMLRDRLLKNQDKLIKSLLAVEEGKYKGSTLVTANDADYNMIREFYKAIGEGDFIN